MCYSEEDEPSDQSRYITKQSVRTNIEVQKCHYEMFFIFYVQNDDINLTWNPGRKSSRQALFNVHCEYSPALTPFVALFRDFLLLGLNSSVIVEPCQLIG